MTLPDVLLELIIRGQWHDLIILRRWHTTAIPRALFIDWPPPDWAPSAEYQPAIVPRDFDEEVLGNMVQVIQSWIPLIEPAAIGPNDDDDDANMDGVNGILGSASRIVSILSSWQSALSGSLPSAEGRGQRMHGASKLLKYLRCAWCAGSTNKLDLVMKHAILASMPGPVALGLLRHLDNKPVHPSKWSLKRYRLALDVAFLYLSQKDG